jgi:signal transduction histidine kinase
MGSVEVEVKEIAPNRLTIAVKDTGIGIAEEELGHIFEEFRQIDQTITRRYPGTGLGLAITKSLVELMQGTIEVKSQLGQGSTFRIELPRTVKPSTPSLPLTGHQLTQLGASSLDHTSLTQALKKPRAGRLLY